MMQHDTGWHEMLQDGIRWCIWCIMVSDSERWCKMLQHSARWNMMTRYSAERCRIVAVGAVWYTVVPDDGRLRSMAPDGDVAFGAK